MITKNKPVIIIAIFMGLFVVHQSNAADWWNKIKSKLSSKKEVEVSKPFNVTKTPISYYPTWNKKSVTTVGKTAPQSGSARRGEAEEQKRQQTAEELINIAYPK